MSVKNLINRWNQGSNNSENSPRPLGNQRPASVVGKINQLAPSSVVGKPSVNIGINNVDNINTANRNPVPVTPKSGSQKPIIIKNNNNNNNNNSNSNNNNNNNNNEEKNEVKEIIKNEKEEKKIQEEKNDNNNKNDANNNQKLCQGQKDENGSKLIENFPAKSNMLEIPSASPLNNNVSKELIAKNDSTEELKKECESLTKKISQLQTDLDSAEVKLHQEERLVIENDNQKKKIQDLLKVNFEQESKISSLLSSVDKLEKNQSVISPLERIELIDENLLSSMKTVLLKRKSHIDNFIRQETEILRDSLTTIKFEETVTYPVAQLLKLPQYREVMNAFEMYDAMEVVSNFNSALQKESKLSFVDLIQKLLTKLKLGKIPKEKKEKISIQLKWLKSKNYNQDLDQNVQTCYKSFRGNVTEKLKNDKKNAKNDLIQYLTENNIIISDLKQIDHLIDQYWNKILTKSLINACKLQFTALELVNYSSIAVTSFQEQNRQIIQSTEKMTVECNFQIGEVKKQLERLISEFPATTDLAYVLCRVSSK